MIIQEKIYELLQHPTLSLVNFQTPYLGHPSLKGQIDLGRRNEVFGEKEKEALALLLKKDPLFFQNDCTIKFCIEKIHTFDCVYIDVNMGRRYLDDEVEYNFINAYFFVFYESNERAYGKRPLRSRHISASDLNPNYFLDEEPRNRNFDRELAVFFQTLQGWFENWKKLRDELRLEIKGNPNKSLQESLAVASGRKTRVKRQSLTDKG